MVPGALNISTLIIINGFCCQIFSLSLKTGVPRSYNNPSDRATGNCFPPDPALLQSVAVLRGIGPKRAAALAGRGIHSLLDLLLFLPVRYEDRSFVSPIDRTVDGKAAWVRGQVISGREERFPRNGRGLFRIVIRDDAATLSLLWFRYRKPHLLRFCRRGTLSRLKVLAEAHDGFKIARRDLEMRGAGLLTGLRQAGAGELDFQEVFREPELLRAARDAAERIAASDPGLSTRPNRPLRAVMTRTAAVPLVP